MKKVWDNLAFILPLLAVAGIGVYALWIRELPKAEGRITGDFAAASELAVKGDIPLYVAVDTSPH